MTAEAKELNFEYIRSMVTADPETVLGRVRELWWPPFIETLKKSTRHGNANTFLDGLDVFMNAGRGSLREMAREYAIAKAPAGDADKITQLTTQFLKSNTGKMFERFVGLAIAATLYERDSSYCLLPFNKQFIRYCPQLAGKGLTVTIALGELSLHTRVDADLFCFNPTDPESEVFLISVKSTLKDRFHNVPFWNLLRRCAISSDFPEIKATNPKLLKHLKYIAICTDLADEQPDFKAMAGPRNLLQIDAALLDGAFITASKANGIIKEGDHIGQKRLAAFHWLSRFVDGLMIDDES